MAGSGGVMDRAVLTVIPIISLGLFALIAFKLATIGECVRREAWNLDGGSVIQAHGTMCAERE